MSVRRPPGAPSPPLTPEQQAYAMQGYPVAVRLARAYAARNRVGYSEADLLSIAHQALTEAVSTFNPDLDKDVEAFIWIRIRGEIKDAIKMRAKELGLRSTENDQTPPPGFLRAAERGLLDYASTLEDPGDVFRDTHEDSVRQFEDVRDGCAAALSAGGAGGLWYMRGEEGAVLREEYTRAVGYLHENVAALTSELSMIMELRYFQQLTVDAVAEKMGISKATADRRIAAAIELLRNRLRARGITEAPSTEGR